MSRVGVIIVNWNGWPWLNECLAGLRLQTFSDFETWIVDNGSSDGSMEFVQRRYPEIRTLRLYRNTGFCRANNLALQHMHAEYVVLLNNDVVPKPEWLQCLVTAMDHEPRAAWAACKLLFHDNPGVIDRAGDGYTLAGAARFLGRGEPAAARARKEWIFGASAAAALYRREMLDALGGFDEDFYLLYEDVDLNFRAQLKGYRCLYVPEAVAFHRASRSLQRDSNISVYYGHRNLEWTYLKNMPAALMGVTILPHLLYNLGCLVFFLKQGQAGAFLRAKMDALRGIPAILAKRRGVQRGRIGPCKAVLDLLEADQPVVRFTSRRWTNSGHR